MKNLFMTPAEASHLIREGAVMVIAGEEALLATLPTGRWIGGTTPYFVADQGGIVESDRLFCTVMDSAQDARAAVLPADDLGRLTHGRYEHGFSYVILPAFSEAHRRYAEEVSDFPGLYDSPVIGWISGIHLSQLGVRSPKVFDGTTGNALDSAGIVLHVRLPASEEAEIDIVNIFEPGEGPAIVFPNGGFAVNACTLDGEASTLAAAIKAAGGDTRLPLVANYAGAMVNVSIQSIDEATSEVKLYAPVVAGETYRLARPMADLAAAYTAGVGTAPSHLSHLSCNCILNFLYSELEGRHTGGYVGPVTFGEIAYILVNQTLVHLSLTHATSHAELLPA